MPSTGDTFSTSSNVDDINAVLQAQLRRRGMDEVSAVEAARWLDGADEQEGPSSRR